jgi:methyl coenzyme M reductase subunit C-like uncharacterized protein (methanogenesis marker protein 7)
MSIRSAIAKLLGRARGARRDDRDRHAREIAALERRVRVVARVVEDHRRRLGREG